MATLESDSLTDRTVTSGFGSDASGNAWTTQAGTPLSGIGVTSGAGAYIKSSSASAFLTVGASATDQDGTVRFKLSSASDAAGILLRFQSTTKYYLFRYSNGMQILKRNGGSTTTLKSATFTPTVGTKYWIHGQVIGTTLNMRWWTDGSAEPSTWNLTITDTAFANGNFGLYGFGSTATGAIFDTFTVTDGAAASNPLRTRAISQFLAAKSLTASGQSKYATRVQGRTRTQAKSSTNIKERTRASAQFKTRSGLRGRGKTTFTIQKRLRGRNETTFRVRKGLSTQAIARSATRISARVQAISRYTLRLALKSRASARAVLQTHLLARTVSRFSLGRRFLTSARSNYRILPHLTSRGVASYRIRAPFATRSHAKSSVRLGLGNRATTRFAIRKGLRARSLSTFQIKLHVLPLAARAIAKFTVMPFPLVLERVSFSLAQLLSSSFATAESLTFAWTAMQLLQATIATVSALSASFTEIQYVPTPNSTIESTVTVTNRAGAAVIGCTPVTCTVSFPDGTSTNYALGSGITDNLDGTYTLKYTTKGPGTHVEAWSITDSSGNVAQPEHKVPVSY